MNQHNQVVLDKLDAVNERVGRLIRLNKWTEDEWNKAIDEVITLTGSNDSAGWLLGEALEEGWLDRRITAASMSPQARSA